MCTNCNTLEMQRKKILFGSHINSITAGLTFDQVYAHVIAFKHLKIL